MTTDFEINILLLVEDSDDDIIITQRKLFKSSLKIGEFLVAKSLTEGIEIVHKKPVDIVLLDLNLPESTGLNTVDLFRKQYDGIIIVCTSLEDELIGIEAIRKGADDYLVKTAITASTLSRAVLYAKERRKVKKHTQSIMEKMALLDNFTGA
jgi:two-component system cell cycle response regulator